MKFFVVLALLLAFARSGESQVPAKTISTRSSSGEFLAYPQPIVPSRFVRSKTDSISLDPALLVIACERVRQTIYSELGITGEARGLVYLHPRQAHFPNEPPAINVQPGPLGWAYQVEIPDTTDEATFVRAITHVVLWEIANRNAGSRSAEIPLWFADGLAENLLHLTTLELSLSSGRRESGMNISRVFFDARRQNPLAQAEIVLRANKPLTFDQLSWQDPRQWTMRDAEVFHSSAQLFVSRLLHFQDGPACFRAMLAELPEKYNWQFAFLNGFQSHFHRALDVEKWWALQLVQFAGHDLTEAWTLDQSRERLDEAIRTTVEIRSDQNALPRRAEIPLQTILREWDAQQQPPALERKLQELTILRLSAAPAILPILDGYRDVIATYLQKQNFSRSLFTFKKPSGPILNKLTMESIAKLDALDKKRESLGPVETASASK
jgi:hypothetical protein